MVGKNILYHRVDNGFRAHVKCNFSTNSRNDVAIVHICARLVRLYDEMHGLDVVRLFGEVDLRCKTDVSRGSKLECTNSHVSCTGTKILDRQEFQGFSRKKHTKHSSTMNDSTNMGAGCWCAS
jgi:hypothetical protein